MDNNNWRPSIPTGEPAMDSGDRRNQLPQQLMSQQNILQATNQQPLGTQGNVAGLELPQRQLFSSQVGNSSLQTNQQSVDMLSQATVTHQAVHGLFSSQGQQLHNQPSLQQIQLHHQQLVLQQQRNLLQQDVQQRLQSSGQVTGALLPPQNVVDQQRQLYQSRRTLTEIPSSSRDSRAQTESANGVDWQEEVFQKIKTMKEAYLPDLAEIHHKVAVKFQQQQYSLPHQQRSEQFEKLKQFKTMLERMIQFLCVSKSSIMPTLKDKVATYEKNIINFLAMHRLKKPVQQGQLPQSQMQPMELQSSQNGDLAKNTGDWRTLHPPDSRLKNVNMLLETLKEHVPYSGKEGIEELTRIAVSFEELIFNTAKNQLDYFCKISLKMQSMEEGS